MRNILNDIKDKASELTEVEFEEMFDAAWNRMRNSFKKLEVEQYYKCDMDHYYLNYINGNFEGLIDGFKDFEKTWSFELSEKTNIILNRLHIITIPLTQYLEYEMYFYLINEKIGEKIKCLDIKNTDLDFSYLYDFIIFDDKEVIINCHKKNGEYVKSLYYNEDISLIEALSKEYDKLFSQGVNYKEFANFNSKLIQELQKENLI